MKSQFPTLSLRLRQRKMMRKDAVPGDGGRAAKPKAFRISVVIVPVTPVSK
jgi:hypothetical protein